MPLTNTSAAPVYLDLEAAIAQIGDLPSVLGILAMVEETLKRDIPCIEDFLAEGNVLPAARLLHSFKGFMPIFCRADICEHVSRVEALSKTGTATEVSPAFNALKPELELLLTEVTNYLKQGSAGS
jgi:hypothetical protein